MKRFIWTFAIIALITSCKTQQCMVPLVVRDSISITYKQGKEQPTPLGTQVPQNISPPLSKKCSLVGTYSLGSSTQSSSSTFAHFPDFVEEGTAASSLEADRQKDIRIRVDTVFVERWHTQVLQPAGRSFSDSGPSESNANGLSAKRSQFYKNCTKGFWILLILFLGGFALRIMRAIYLRK